MRILVLDDDTTYRRSLARTLRRFWPDADIRFAATSAEAHSYIATEPFDLLLLDWILGANDEDRNGGAFLRRARDRGCATPAVLVSGFDETALAKWAEESGAHAWLSKLDLAALPATVDRLLAPDRETSLPADLRALVDRVLLADSERARAEARCAYALAELARAALSADARPGLVRDCARAVGLKRNTLSVYAPLARWSLDRLTTFLETKNARGENLTVSHAKRLASLPDTASQAITRQAQAMSVETVRNLLGKRKPPVD